MRQLQLLAFSPPIGLAMSGEWLRDDALHVTVTDAGAVGAPPAPDARRDSFAVRSGEAAVALVDSELGVLWRDLTSG